MAMVLETVHARESCYPDTKNELSTETFVLLACGAGDCSCSSDSARLRCLCAIRWLLLIHPFFLLLLLWLLCCLPAGRRPF